MNPELNRLFESDLRKALLRAMPLQVDPSVLDTLEAGTDRILAEVGLQFEGDPETLDLWRSAGANVRDERVRLEGAWLRDIIRTQAPGAFLLKGRNPARSTCIGGGAPAVFAPVYGPPHVRLENGVREAGSLELYRKLVTLAHAAPALGNTGHMICVPDDVPEIARPMEMALAHLTLSDKPFMGSVASPQATAQLIAAAQLAASETADGDGCFLLHLLNASPPLRWMKNPLQCLRVAARAGQGCLITSWMMMGATSPVTTLGSLIQGYAEVLAGMALAQLWSPGTPVVMGLYGAPFSMRTMLPVFGDPASYLIQIYAGALARRLGVPVRGEGGITSSNLDDALAGLEGANATMAAQISGADFILHAAGWLEQGRCVSVTKFIREAESLGPRAGLEPANDPVVCLPLDPALEAELRARIPV